MIIRHQQQDDKGLNGNDQGFGKRAEIVALSEIIYIAQQITANLEPPGGHDESVGVFLSQEADGDGCVQHYGSKADQISQAFGQGLLLIQRHSAVCFVLFRTQKMMEYCVFVKVPFSVF